MSENLETRDTFVFSRTITREDVVGICQLMGLDPWSPDSSTLRPLMQSFATGPAWTPLANLAGFNAIPVSSALEYAARLRSEIPSPLSPRRKREPGKDPSRSACSLRTTAES